MIRRLSLIAVLIFVPAALAQDALTYFPATGTDPHYPFELWLRNETKTPFTVRLGDARARLAPVTPDLGKVSHARLAFAPGVPRTVTLPPNSLEAVKLPFRLVAGAGTPRGVYALEPNLPGGGVWDNPPGYDSVADYPLAYTPNLQVPQPYRPGQRFLFLGEGAKHYRVGKRTPKHRQLYGHMFTLRRYDGKTAYFGVEGVSQPVELKLSSRRPFPGLAPLLDDLELPALRQAYLGHRVWLYGGPRLGCSYSPGTRITFAGPPRKAVRIRRIVRVAWPTGFALAGTDGFGGYNAASPGDIMVVTPLVVQFEKPTGLAFSVAYGGGDLVGVTTRTSDAELLRRCPPLTTLLADPWQLPTVFSLTPPPKLPRITKVNDYLGLTRSQYAWLRGYPSTTFGTLPRLLKLKQWKYANIPFPITVSFDRTGHVVKRDEPRLP